MFIEFTLNAVFRSNLLCPSKDRFENWTNELIFHNYEAYIEVARVKAIF